MSLRQIRRLYRAPTHHLQVAIDGGKQKGGKGSKKASRGSTPATDAATTSGGEAEDGEDRWDFECIKCGQEGDPLLCCEVGLLHSAFEG